MYYKCLPFEKGVSLLIFTIFIPSFCNDFHTGQVVIVVNASSFFSGQSDSETPTTLSLTIPASQVASLSHASLHSAAGSQAVAFIPQANTTAQTQGSAATPQTVAFIPQALDSSRGAVAFLTSQQTDSINQVPVSAAYLAAHGQSGNILSMLDSALQASAGGTSPVIRVGSNLGTVQIADSSQAHDSGNSLWNRFFIFPMLVKNVKVVSFIYISFCPSV